MSPAVPTEVGTQAPALPRERPWLFAFLIAPDAVISLGLVGGALAFLLRNEGIDPARAASINALIALPHAIYFLWGPITDFWFQRRIWLLIASAATAATIVFAFHLPRLGSPWGVGLLFLAASLAVLTPSACGGMMAALRSELNRRRASSFYQTGSLAIGALAVFAIASLSARFSLGALGMVVAVLIVLPALAALAAPREPIVSEHTLRKTVLRILGECNSTFLRWEAIPYALVILCPAGSGAMIGLLGALARDYGVSGRQVAWINGIGGALLTSAGAIAASFVPVRVRATVAYLVSGLINAATTAILALGPMRPSVYLAGSVLYLFTVGASYALFTAVLLEFLGDSGKSGGGRYSIVNSLGNVPVVYMTWLDGRGYALWGPRGMPGLDTVVSAIVGSVLLAHYIVSRSRRQRRARQEACV